mmetsp:Transcript_11844/g.19438  ORF Transcript_11844/g.19438 Transcript_11844/m.19438 type:complete len:506 (-) Transcript_11844:135-1652(-)
MGNVSISCCEKRDKDSEQPDIARVLTEPDAELKVAIRGSSQHVNDPDLEHFCHTFVAAPSSRSFEEAYEVERGRNQELGVGASGSVHRAVERTSKQEFAVKTIDRKGMNQHNLAALKTEMNIMSILDHPHIVKLHEYFEEGDKTIMVMELLTGGELFDRIANSRRGFSEHQAAGYMRQILLAMAYLHKLNIAHRDIKPENFMMQDNSDDTNIKLIDFGIAAKIRPGGKLRTAIGTEDYLAPEIFAYNCQYDWKADIWSCGVVLYVMLTGRRFHIDAKKKRILQEGFRIEGMEGLSDGAKAFMRSMLTVNPDERLEAADLLHHAWLDAEAPRHCASLDDGMIGRLRSFNRSRKLKQICMTFVATQLNEVEVASMRSVFESLDVNGDGSLSLEELRNGMQAVGLAPEDIEAFMALDSDGSGEVDWTEFLAAAVDLQTTRKKEIIANAFRKFDIDGDGEITKAELSKVLAGEAEGISEKKIQELMDEADLDGNGTISLEEFETMMLTR